VANGVNCREIIRLAPLYIPASSTANARPSLKYRSFVTLLLRAYADAAADHRLEVIEHQTRAWLTDPEQIALLAKQQAILPAALDRITSGPYRLVRGKLCYLDRHVFLHLVFSDGTREFSLYLRPREVKARSEPVGEIANGKRLCTADFERDHVAFVESSDVVAFFRRRPVGRRGAEPCKICRCCAVTPAVAVLTRLELF